MRELLFQVLGCIHIIEGVALDADVKRRLPPFVEHEKLVRDQSRFGLEFLVVHGNNHCMKLVVSLRINYLFVGLHKVTLHGN